MNRLELDFSFRKDISQIQKASRSSMSSSLPKEFSSCGLSSSFNSMSTSRFEEKKVLRKLKEQEVLNRIAETFKSFSANDELLKETFKFRPIRSRRNRQEKENQ